MTTKQEDILRRVRGLMAKAASTEFEGEREAFQAKADQLMEAYAIETWMLQTGEDESKARLIVKRDFDMSWWSQLGHQVSWETKSNVWYLFTACVKHCRCFTSTRTFGFDSVPVFGMEADLNYLDLLFTDLFTQLFAKIKPQYDPDKSMGENVMRAKEAGMKYIDIAVWLGHPEWRVPNGTGGYKTADNGKMLREYKSYLKSIGKTPKDVVTVHPASWALSYTYGFYTQVAARLHRMREDREAENTGSNALALRDIEMMAREAYDAMFPPPEATGRRSRAVARSGPRIVQAGMNAGTLDGGKARIISNAPGVTRTKELS
jgi:hypothetical protein